MGRVGIRSFSSRGRNARKMLIDDDVGDLFEATTPSNQDLKHHHQQKQQQESWPNVSWPEMANEEKEEEEEEETKEGKYSSDLLNIVTSASSGKDVFDGLSLNPSSSAVVAPGEEAPDSECQAREDVDDDEVKVVNNNKKVSAANDEADNDNDDKKGTRDEYAGFREEMLSDDETTSISSGYTSATSTLSSMAPRNGHAGGDVLCQDDLEIGKLLFQFGETGAESVDEMNRFLYSELEVGGLIEGVEEFRQDMVRNGMEKLSEIGWKELLGTFSFPGNEENPTLPSSDTPASAAEPQEDSASIPEETQESRALVPVNQTTTTAAAVAAVAAAATTTTAAATATSESLAECLSGMNELKLEEEEDFEGFEMPFPSWEEFINKDERSDEKRSSKRRNSFLSKLRYPSPKRGRIASAPVRKTPKVLRMKLKDGSMASVSAETVARLQMCHWV